MWAVYALRAAGPDCCGVGCWLPARPGCNSCADWTQTRGSLLPGPGVTLGRGLVLAGAGPQVWQWEWPWRGLCQKAAAGLQGTTGPRDAGAVASPGSPLHSLSCGRASLLASGVFRVCCNSGSCCLVCAGRRWCRSLLLHHLPRIPQNM